MQRFVGRVLQGTNDRKNCKVVVEHMIKRVAGPRVELRQKKYWVRDPKGKAVNGDIVAIEYGRGILGMQGDQSVAFRLTEILMPAIRAKHPVTGKLVTVPRGITPVRYECYEHNQK